MKKVKIITNQVGIIFKDGIVSRVLQQGTYYISFFDTVEIFDMSKPFHVDIEPAILLQNETLKSLLEVIEVNDNEIAFIFINKNFKQVVTTGIYMFFKGVNELTYQKYSTSNYMINAALDIQLLMRAEVIPFIRIYTIEMNEKGLLFADGEFVNVLEPGQYRYFRNAINLQVIKTDMRQMNMDINGQEILTKDKAQLRMNFILQYKVIDIKKALLENKDYDKQLYIILQLAMREVVGRLTFDELMEGKEAISEEVKVLIEKNAFSLGIEVMNCGVKDIILSGEIKDIMNQVLIAEKKAQANMITRREETSATRSLLNTAKLMEDNAMLFKLKEMEYVEKIAEKINNISLSGNVQIIDQLRTIFVKG